MMGNKSHSGGWTSLAHSCFCIQLPFILPALMYYFCGRCPMVLEWCYLNLHVFYQNSEVSPSLAGSSFNCFLPHPKLHPGFAGVTKQISPQSPKYSHSAYTQKYQCKIKSSPQWINSPLRKDFFALVQHDSPYSDFKFHSSLPGISSSFPSRARANPFGLRMNLLYQ